MRTKTLIIAAAAITAGVLSSQAQSNVYSANIVGYVNVQVQGANKLTLLSNPLKPANGDYNITNTITGLPDSAEGANLFKWTGTAWDNNVPGWYGGGGGWYPDAVIPAGQSFFIQSPVALTLTFVGEVSTGANGYTLTPGINFVANKVPVAGPFPGGSAGNIGDNIFLWTGSAWNNTVWSYYADYGWYGTGDASESTNGPALTVGSGFAYQNLGATVNFTNVFNP